MHSGSQPSFLIVNADDYGYFPGISRGIIDAHKDGVVTATGVLANGTSFLSKMSADFARHILWMQEFIST